ncbi:MAG: Wadjet anti-phage system protein JetD domain-containing protein, partial [Chloroflexota bacterium]
MISPDEIREKALRKYLSFLGSVVRGGAFFPLDIPFRKAKASDDYTNLNKWVGTLRDGGKRVKGYGYTVTLQERNHRLYGRQSLPSRIAFETQPDFLKTIGKTAEFHRFEQAIDLTKQQFPQLIHSGWLARYPQRVLANLENWASILQVCAYFVAHPRPNLYMREIPIEVHSKFIESHQGILRHLLDELLPADAILSDENHFSRRYGLRYDEPQIRLRLLDTALATQLGWPAADLTLKMSDHAKLLGLQHSIVIIVENKMTFLTLPQIKNGVAIWGKGFQVNALRSVKWLAHCEIWYWGDLDAQGFEILSQLRSYYPQTRSFLMDQATLSRYSHFVVTGTPAEQKSLLHLTADEAAVYAELVAGNQRLEQERIDQKLVDQTIYGL